MSQLNIYTQKGRATGHGASEWDRCVFSLADAVDAIVRAANANLVQRRIRLDDGQ